MSKSQFFLFVCLAFVAGIFLSSFFTISQLLIVGFLILGIFLISVPPLLNIKKKWGFVMAGFCFLFLAAGVWRHQQAVSQIYYPKEEKVVFNGKVVQEADIREDNMKLIVETTEIAGKILVTLDRYPEYNYGDRLKIKGNLQLPMVFEDFNYKDYLAKDGIYSVMYYPKVELLERKNYDGLSSVIYAKILELKNKLRESIYQSLSPPQSSILAAMILGDKKQISEDLKQSLNMAGVRHITAVSGLHITILTTILMTLLLSLGFWRHHSFYFAIILITLFIIMTGLQSSAIRAGIMGGLFLLAQHLGRMNSSSRIIFFAAAIMLALNPLLLRFDVGFQLSFLAMMGIIYLSPIFKKWVKLDVLAMTLAAQLFTLPILIYNFGYMSFIAPLTNVLIVPLLPFIMLFGFIFSLVGIFWQSLGLILSFPAWLLLTYLLKIVDWFSSLSISALILEISWRWLIIAYLILGFSTWYFNKKQKLKFLNY